MKRRNVTDDVIAILITLLLGAAAALFAYYTARTTRGDGVRPVEVNVPFAYDVNVCDGEIVAWAYSEPNVAIYYSCWFFTKSGRTANPLIVQVDHTQMPVPLSLLYHGRTKLDPNDPNGPGWVHEWTVGYVPMYTGVHALNITATYGPKNSDKKAFLQKPGPNEQDTRTVLYDVVLGDAPFLMNGNNPTEIALKQKQQTFQYAMKQKSLYFGVNQPVMR